ncbi:MAG: hypothetical protein IJ680_06095 [Paludibacteraceae bacterium]|nr:hypothetical protein [Paludibacteraceae bacterium]
MRPYIQNTVRVFRQAATACVFMLLTACGSAGTESAPDVVAVRHDSQPEAAASREPVRIDTLVMQAQAEVMQAAPADDYPVMAQVRKLVLNYCSILDRGQYGQLGHLFAQHVEACHQQRNLSPESVVLMYQEMFLTDMAAVETQCEAVIDRMVVRQTNQGALIEFPMELYVRHESGDISEYIKTVSMYIDSTYHIVRLQEREDSRYNTSGGQAAD